MIAVVKKFLISNVNLVLMHLTLGLFVTVGSKQNLRHSKTEFAAGPQESQRQLLRFPWVWKKQKQKQNKRRQISSNNCCCQKHS